MARIEDTSSRCNLVKKALVKSVSSVQILMVMVDGELANWLIILPPTPPRVPPPQVVVVGDPLSTDFYNFSAFWPAQSYDIPQSANLWSTEFNAVIFFTVLL